MPTLEEIEERFLQKLALLKEDPEAMRSHNTYYKAAVVISSKIIRDLRSAGASSQERQECNNMVFLHLPDYKDFLYAKDPTCKLCGLQIMSMAEVTLDHIVPKSKGGTGKRSNLQLAHASCNVLKGDRLITTLKELNDVPLELHN